MANETAEISENVFFTLMDKVKKAGDSFTEKDILEYVMYGSSTKEEKNAAEAKYKIAKNLRENINREFINLLNENYQKITSSAQELQNFSDPFGLLELKEKAKKTLEEKWDSIKKKIDSLDIDLSQKVENIIKESSGKTATDKASAPKGFALDPDTTKIFSSIADKLQKLVDVKKEEPKYKIDESKIRQVKRTTGLSYDQIESFIKMAKESKVKKASPLAQKFYEKDKKTFELDEKSILEISKKLNLKDKEVVGLLKAMAEKDKDGEKEENNKSGKETIIDWLEETFAALALGVAALIVGKPVLQLVDKMFGTQLTEAFEGVTKSVEAFRGYILDGLKVALMAISVLTQTLKGFGKNLFRPLTAAISSTASSIGSSIASIFKVAPKAAAAVESAATMSSKYKFNEKTGRWHDIETNKMVKSSVVEAEKAAGDVGKTAVKAATGKAAVGAEKVAANALAGSIEKTGVKAIAKVGLGSLMKKGLGFILRKIPFIGGIIDMAEGIKDFVEGDYVGGILRVLGAAANFIPFAGPFISMFIDFLDDALSEKAATSGEKKSFGMLGNMMKDFGKKVIKWFIDFIPEPFRSMVIKTLGLDFAASGEASATGTPEKVVTPEENKLPPAKPSPLPAPVKAAAPPPPNFRISKPEMAVAPPDFRINPEMITASPEVINASSQLQVSQETNPALMIPAEIQKGLNQPYGISPQSQGSITIKDLARNDVMPSMMAANNMVGLDPESVELISQSIGEAVSAGDGLISIPTGGGNMSDDDAIILTSRNDHLDYEKSKYRYSPNRSVGL